MKNIIDEFVYGVIKYQFGGMATPEQKQAIRLMQAAPALLEACERMAMLFNRDGFQELRGKAWCDDDLVLLQIAIDNAVPWVSV